MNELTEGIDASGQLRKYQEEIRDKQKLIEEQNEEIEELKDQVSFYKEECEKLDDRQDFPDYLKNVIKDKDKEIEGLRKTCTSLREYLMNPPPDVQEKVLQMLEVYQKIKKYTDELNEIEQILGKALGYPWFKDDPKNFPNATEADGVAVGDHIAWSLAMEAADKMKMMDIREQDKQKIIDEQREEIAKLKESVEYYSDMMLHYME
jgi:DNA repair exonuclease SbcCD ATPase subunit